MELRVELIHDCPNCYGNGAIYLTDQPRLICPRCYGMGQIPTDDGQELLDFIERFTGDRQRRKENYEYDKMAQAMAEKAPQQPQPPARRPDARKL